MSDARLSRPALPGLFGRIATRAPFDDARWRTAAFVGLFGLVLLPTLVTPIPAMVDYLNHLARMYEIAADGTAAASPFYHVVWRLYPNLAMDLLVPQLAHVFGVETATRVFFLCGQILVVTGALAIEWVVKRRWEASGPLALMSLSSLPFAWGFVNFEFALGIALWSVAAWIALRERSWLCRGGVHALAVATLFVCHLFALGLYGATIGLIELHAARTARPPPRRIAATFLVMALPALAGFIVMRATGGSVGGSINTWALWLKPIKLFMVLNGYDVATSAIETSVLLVLAVALWRDGALRFAGAGADLAIGFAVLYVLVPSRLFDTEFVDVRVVVGALLVLPAFASLANASLRQKQVALAVVVAATTVNAAWTACVWTRYQPVYRAMIASFARLGTGARVLVAANGDAPNPPLQHLSDYPLYHAPTLAVPYAKAFVPTLFTSVGKQPLTVDRSVRRLAFSCGGPVPLADLRAALAGQATGDAASVIRTWPRDFDWIYLLGPPPAANPMPEAVDIAESQPDFTLLKVRKPR